MHLSHVKGLGKHRLLNPTTSDPEGPVGEGGEVCISGSFPDDAPVVCCMENNRNQGKESGSIVKARLYPQNPSTSLSC